MIDFVKMRHRQDYTPPSYIDLISEVNAKTGELSNKSTGTFNQMKIKKYESGMTWISGSLHKYYNQCDFNGNDLKFNDVKNAISQLSKDFEVNPSDLILENCEIGINIGLSFEPNNLLNQLLFHRSKPFTKPLVADYYQSEKDRYVVKIYNKFSQYTHKLNKPIDDVLFQKIDSELIQNAMRFELKYTKMKTLNDLGVFTLQDLTNEMFYPMFNQMILEEWNEVYFYDYTFNDGSLKPQQLSKIKDYRNPNYWRELNPKDRYYHKQKFDNLTYLYSDNSKKYVSELINQKWELLMQ